MNKKLLLFSLIFFCSVLAKAQIYNIHNFYTQNLFYYSPAHAGDKEELAAFINFRNHLQDFDDNSQTAVVGLHSPAGDKMSVGGLIKTERLGLFETLSARLDYSFRTKIAGKHVLAFGINLGAMQRNLNIDNVIVEPGGELDPTLRPDYIKDNVFFSGASMSYNYKNFEFDFGIPLLYRSGDITYTNYWSFLSYSLYSGSKKWQFQPSAAFNYSNDRLFAYQANLLINYENIFWVQPTYKVNGSIAVSFGINLKKIGLAYAYETNSGSLSVIGGPSQEIMISYGFYKQRRGRKDTLINKPDYKHKLKAKIGDKTFEEYVSANNYGFYNNIIALTDSIHKEEVRKIEESKNTLNTDSIESARLAIIEQAGLDAIEQSKRDSVRMHHLRNVTDQEMDILKIGVHFELGSAMLNQDSREYLDKVVLLIKKNPNIKMLISGHTCDIGTEKINLMYSQDRAEAVEYYLVNKGVSNRQISTDLKLDAEPIVPNTSEENRQQNRRVSFSIIKE